MCPECRRRLEALPAAGQTMRLPRCPQHGLAYVAESEVKEYPRDSFLGRTIVDRFVVLARLGAGSMGAVYRARQEAVGRDVALKLVRRDRAYDPEIKARFEREARAMSSLTSPHTVTIFDFGEADDGSWFLAMEMLRGETLGERLRRDGALPWREALRITRQALLSLSEAHRQGIIHRDLKPDNLFLMTRAACGEADSPGICKVLDFGIAKLEHDHQKLDQLETQAGTVFGTPRYMSPEQAQGAELDARSDLYSLGVILFQMLAGRAPFVDDDAVVVMAKHIKDAPPALASIAPDAHVPVAVERLVGLALAKVPSMRVQTAEQFIAELDRLIGEADEGGDSSSSVSTTAALVPVARSTPLERPQGHARMALGAALVATVLAVLVGTVWFGWRRAGLERGAAASGITLGTPAAMPHAWNPPAGATEPNDSQHAGASAENPAASASTHPASAVATPTDPAGPPTQEPYRVRAIELPRSAAGSSAAGSSAAGSSVAGSSAARSTVTRSNATHDTMEPKRPDERYGRFR